MAAAIYPLRFAYLSPEPELLDYVRRLEEAERANPPDGVAPAAGAPPDDAITALKTEMVKQYAAATHRNRRINQRRALFRSVSGLCMPLGVLSILVLVAVTMRHHVVTHGVSAGAPTRGEAGGATAQRDRAGPRHNRPERRPGQCTACPGRPK